MANQVIEYFLKVDIGDTLVESFLRSARRIEGVVDAVVVQKTFEIIRVRVVMDNDNRSVEKEVDSLERRLLMIYELQRSIS